MNAQWKDIFDDLRMILVHELAELIMHVSPRTPAGDEWKLAIHAALTQESEALMREIESGRAAR